MPTHSSIPAWRIPWTEEPGGLQSMGSQRVGHNWVTNTFTFIVLPHFGVILKNLDLWNNTFLSNSICQPIIYLLHVSFCFIWFSDFMVYKHIKTCLNELRFPSILSGEGNGTPRQYSCLENPMDAGAWWAAVHGWLRVGHDWATSLSLFTFIHWRWTWQPTLGDGGAWWAAVYGVAQSRTQLKQLSSSSKQGDNIQPWRTPFPIWNQSVVPCPVLTVASWPAYRFLRSRSDGLVFPLLEEFSTVCWDPHSQRLCSSW